MWAAHPTSNLAPPLVVVEGCGCTENVKAGTQSQSEERSTLDPRHKNVDS